MTLKNKPNREFRKIPSLDFLYEVNNNGTIIRNVKSKKCLKCYRFSHNSKTEYWGLNINLKGKIKKVYIHKVVAECWLGKKPKGYQIDHIDRNSLNNHYKNLRYVTKSEQMINRDYDSENMKNIIKSNLLKPHNLIINPIRLVKDGVKLDFPTARRAAKYLARTYSDKKEKSFNDKFYHRRKHIFDYDVIYLNEETIHYNQETGKK